MLELLAALIIISILTALAATKIDADRYYVDGAIQEASTALTVAQREAVSLQHNVLIVFDTTHATMRMVWDKNANGIEDTGEHTRVTALSDRVKFGRPASVPKQGLWDLTITAMRDCSGLPCLIVQRNGSLDREAAFYITSARAMQGIPNREHDSRMVEINRATARAQTWKYTGTDWRRGY